MLRLRERTPSQATSAALDELQGLVNAGRGFRAKVELAKGWWKKKKGTKAREQALDEVREFLASMCYGSVRCSYCEDSAADEIEHIAPKTVFPDRAFRWSNYCFSCGPCNGPKGNRFAIVAANGSQQEVDPEMLTGQPVGTDGLINPRREDPTRFLELDIGGVTAGGLVLTSTVEFLAREGLSAKDEARARWTIELLDLNRELVRKARETAYQSYRASLTEYADAKGNGATQSTLDTLRDGILAMPHPTVLNEMISQSATQPAVQRAIAAAPEIGGWLR